jgi:hypothetical protein
MGATEDVERRYSREPASREEIEAQIAQMEDRVQKLESKLGHYLDQFRP